MKLWLDDIREAPEGWEWVKNYDEAILAFELEEIEAASLDHDLGYDLHPDDDELRVYPALGVAKLGNDVLWWIIENEKWPRNSLAVHSANPVGARNMCLNIEHYGPYDKKERFTMNDYIYGVRYYLG